MTVRRRPACSKKQKQHIENLRTEHAALVRETRMVARELKQAEEPVERVRNQT